MKITTIKSFPIMANRDFFFVKVETDEGIYGIGEAGIQFWGYAMGQIVRHLEELLVGEDPLSTEMLWQRMFRATGSSPDRVACSAISAIDIALWDIKGKTLGLPLYKLLGGPVRDKVVCYPHNNGEQGTQELLDSCRRTVAEGWKFVRWGLPCQPNGILDPSESVRMGVKQVAAVRDLVGDDIEVLLSVHNRLDTAHVVGLCRQLEPYRLFWVEEPLRPENPASLRTLARHVAVPIAAGAGWASKWSYREVIEEELVRYVRMDPCIVGGLTEALKVTHWCETHYIDIAPHNPPNPVGSAACAHLCLASTNVGVLEMGEKPGTVLPDVFPVQIPWEDGYVLKPTRPGLGVEFNEEAALEYTRKYEPGYPRMLHRKDGAFTNF